MNNSNLQCKKKAQLRHVLNGCSSVCLFLLKFFVTCDVENYLFLENMPKYADKKRKKLKNNEVVGITDQNEK